MIDEKKIKEVENRMKQFIADRLVLSKQKVEHVQFFLKNAEDSINSAQCLFDISTNKEFQKSVGHTNLNGFLWVINASYYSMFYMARALLEHSGIKLKSDLSVHMVTFDALVYYFYLTGKLQKKLFELYADAQKDATELLGKQRADEIIESYFHEKRKRAKFTYETGEHAMENKAKTSLKRAFDFNLQIKKLIE